MKTVLLKFAGPLQAWGTDSHFETRHTDSHPSKSGVIGMIAAGLGCSREDDDVLKKLNTLSYAVRIDQKGTMLRDFHIAGKYKNGVPTYDKPYVTNRWYLQDAVFIAALGSDEENLINKVVTAVTKPYFPLFLGRRSLPPTADLLLGIVEGDPFTVLKTYPWQASASYRKHSTAKLEIFSDASLVQGSIRYRMDEAVSFSRARGRQFSVRPEVRSIADAVFQEIESEHDAFGAVQEG